MRTAATVLSIALLGATGCMGEDDLVRLDDVADDGSFPEAEALDEAEQAEHEDVIGDLEVAAAIAEARMTEFEPATTALRHAPCGTPGPNVGNERVNDAAITGAARQRSGSSTGCTAPGAIQPSDDVIYFCWTWQSDFQFSWTYLRNLRTGVRGWVRDDLLRFGGALNEDWCGF